MVDGSRQAAHREAIRERILVLHGAMGTATRDPDRGPDDAGGAELEGCNENVVLTRPGAVRKIHLGYRKPGADIIETSTSGRIRMVLPDPRISPRDDETERRIVACDRCFNAGCGPGASSAPGAGRGV